MSSWGLFVKFKKLVVGAIAVAATLTGTGVAMAALNTTYPDGGIWNTGIEGGRVKSHYYHHTDCHSATVYGAWTDQTGWIWPGHWAKAEAPVAETGNKSFYNKNDKGGPC